MSGRADEAIRMMIDSDFLQNIARMNPDSIAQLMKELKIDSNLINIAKYFSDNGKMNEYNSKISDALKNIDSMTDDGDKKYVEDTSELTALEKMENHLSFLKDDIESWNSVFNLANIALGMYIASGFTKVIGGLGKFIGGWKDGGGLAGGLKSLLGVGGGRRSN